MCWFFACMVHYPEWQAKVQAEIDQLTANCSRFVVHQDRAELPTLMACLAESLRMRPIALISQPRVVVDDTMLGGYGLTQRTDWRAAVSEILSRVLLLPHHWQRWEQVPR